MPELDGCVWMHHIWNIRGRPASDLYWSVSAKRVKSSPRVRLALYSSRPHASVSCARTVVLPGPLQDNDTLTPGRVFCSCSAFWALRADSRAQYVRKAHPGKTEGGASHAWNTEAESYHGAFIRDVGLILISDFCKAVDYNFPSKHKKKLKKLKMFRL